MASRLHNARALASNDGACHGTVDRGARCAAMCARTPVSHPRQVRGRARTCFHPGLLRRLTSVGNAALYQVP